MINDFLGFSAVPVNDKSVIKAAEAGMDEMRVGNSKYSSPEYTIVEAQKQVH